MHSARRAMDRWAYTNGVVLDYSRRGKPTDNAGVESFNGRFREECLTPIDSHPLPNFSTHASIRLRYLSTTQV